MGKCKRQECAGEPLSGLMALRSLHCVLSKWSFVSIMTWASRCLHEGNDLELLLSISRVLHEGCYTVRWLTIEFLLMATVMMIMKMSILLHYWWLFF